MKIQEFDPTEIIENPTIAARRGEPDIKKVRMFADNFIQRRESGRSHMIMPGVVRINEDNKPEVVAGRHRNRACAYLNKGIQEGMDPYMFLAVAVPSDDKQALIDAIHENVFRVAETVFDQADAMMRLMEMDKDLKQEDVARQFNLAPSTVSGILRAGKFNKKLQAMMMGNSKNAPWTNEAILAYAAYADDPQASEEILTLAQANFEARKAIAERANARAANPGEAAKEEATEEVEAEAEEGEETPAPKGKKGTAPVSDAVKNKKKGAKSRVPTKVSGEDVKSAARQTGKAKRKPAKKAEVGRGKVQLLTFLQATFGSKAQDAPKSCRKIAAKIEEFFDNACDEAALKRSFVNNCVPDEAK